VSPDTAAPLVPARPSLRSLRAAAADCRACPLWRTGTQTVFGEGRVAARMLLVGEQPGDREDLEGRPFVGPAGRLLDDALEEAGIDRSLAYVTNVVKHFKWTPRGKRRIHEKPTAREVEACRPWFQTELDLVKPDLVVALGATAAQSLLGPAVRVTKERGHVLDAPLGARVLLTVHPSSLLRITDDAERDQAMERFVADLRVAARTLEGRGR
jgi:uracil-DNA glycosylase